MQRDGANHHSALQSHSYMCWLGWRRLLLFQLQLWILLFEEPVLQPSSKRKVNSGAWGAYSYKIPQPVIWRGGGIKTGINSALNLVFWQSICKINVKHVIIKELMGGERSISGGCDTYKHPLSQATPCHHSVFLVFKASVDACAGWCVAMDTVVSVLRQLANGLICLCTSRVKRKKNPVICVAASKGSLTVKRNDCT